MKGGLWTAAFLVTSFLSSVGAVAGLRPGLDAEDLFAFAEWSWCWRWSWVWGTNGYWAGLWGAVRVYTLVGSVGAEAYAVNRCVVWTSRFAEGFSTIEAVAEGLAGGC